MKRVSNEKISEALIKTGGLLQAAADALGITRVSLWRWQKDDKELQEVIFQCREKIKDIVESKLWKEAQKGNTAVLIFMAKTLCRDRGYIERQEITGADGKAIPIITLNIDANTIQPSLLSGVSKSDNGQSKQIPSHRSVHKNR